MRCTVGWSLAQTVGRIELNFNETVVWALKASAGTEPSKALAAELSLLTVLS